MPQGIPEEKIDQLFMAIRHDWSDDSIARNRAIYNEALELVHANDFRTFVTLCVTCLFLGKFGEARKWADHAYAFRNFNIPGAANALADAFLAMGDLKRGVEIYARLFEDPTLTIIEAFRRNVIASSIAIGNSEWLQTLSDYSNKLEQKNYADEFLHWIEISKLDDIWASHQLTVANIVSSVRCGFACSILIEPECEPHLIVRHFVACSADALRNMEDKIFSALRTLYQSRGRKVSDFGRYITTVLEPVPVAKPAVFRVV